MSALHGSREIPDAREYPLSTYRNTIRWPALGPIDARLVVAFLVALISKVLFLPFYFLVGVFIVAKFMNTTPERLFRVMLGKFIVPMITGNSLHATPFHWKRSVPFALVAALLGTTLAFPEQAYADYRVYEEAESYEDENAESSQAPQPRAARRASMNDTRAVKMKSQQNPIVQGFGTGLPLALALQQILGDEYEIFYENPDVAEMIVSWRGGDRLVSVLNRLANSTGLDLELDPIKRVLNVSGEMRRRGAVRMAEGEEDSAETVVATNAALQKRKFEIVNGESLKTALQRWCSDEQYTLVWRVGYDYDIAAKASFEGNLFSAVSSLVRAYESQGELLDAEFIFSTHNKVLTVQDVDRYLDVGTVPR